MKKLKKKEKSKGLVKEVLKKPMRRNPRKSHPRERSRKGKGRKKLGRKAKKTNRTPKCRKHKQSQAVTKAIQ